MSYVALYRKYRPQTFEQVRGQDHVVRTLKNQIKNNRVGHAYLFTGTRGTGKTSIAKIFAKAINCLDTKDGNPCNECESCREITAGKTIDVVEIDAASNTGVDDIRRVIEEVQYTPVKEKYKIYIIDEAHMLSGSAANAFLKTLEEPPEYVVFILATTEPYKLPITILSRCQRYDFKRISVDDLTANLRFIVDSEGVEIEDRALRYIAILGDGSSRDSISLLDKCIAFSLGKKIAYEDVLNTLGVADTSTFSKMYRSVLNGDAVSALKEVDRAVDTGKDLSQFVSDFVWYLRNLLILNADENAAGDVLGVSNENLTVLKEDAKLAKGEILIRYIRVLSELLNQMKFAMSKRILAEVAIIKLAKPEMECNLDSINDRVRQLEDKLNSGYYSAGPEITDVPEYFGSYEPEFDPYVAPETDSLAAPQTSWPETHMKEPQESPREEEPVVSETKNSGSDGKEIVDNWEKVLAYCNDPIVKTLLMSARVEAVESGIEIYAESDFKVKQLKQESDSIKEIIKTSFGVEKEIIIKKGSSRKEVPNQQSLDDLLNNINMTIGTEEA